MLEAEKQVRLVGKLLKMTNAGEMCWSAVGSSGLDDGDNAFDIYEAQSGAMTFRLHQHTQVAVGPLQKLLGINDNRVLGLYHSEKTSTSLEVISIKDGGRRIIIDTGDMPLLKNLFSAVRKSVTSIDADIEAFIGQEERHAERHHG